MNTFIVVDGIPSPSESTPSATRRRRKSKGGEKPYRPKPPNPFILFSLENRQRIAEENPDISNSEISRMLGVAWRRLHPDEKRKYKTRAAEVKEGYQEDPEFVFNPHPKDSASEHLSSLFHELYKANASLNILSGVVDEQEEEEEEEEDDDDDDDDDDEYEDVEEGSNESS